MGIKEIYAKIDEMADQVIEKVDKRSNGGLDLFTSLCVKTELMVFMIETMDAGEVIPDTHQVQDLSASTHFIDRGEKEVSNFVRVDPSKPYTAEEIAAGLPDKDRRFPPAPPTPTMFYGGSVYYGMEPAGDYGIWHDAAGRPHIIGKDGWIEARGFEPTFSGKYDLDVRFKDGTEGQTLRCTSLEWSNVQSFKADEIPF